MDNTENNILPIANLYRISTSLLTIRNTEELLDFFVSEAANISSSEICAILLFNPRNPQNLVIRKQIGLAAGKYDNMPVSREHPLVWESFEKKKTIYHLEKDPNNPCICKLFSEDYPISSCFITPLQAWNSTIGVCYLGRTTPEPYQIEEERMLTILLNNYSVAYENLSAMLALQEKVKELEKFQSAVTDREMVMMNLKKEIARLKKDIPPKAAE